MRVQLLALVCAPLFAAPLEKFLAVSFPQDLVAAPGGGKVAWMMNERGPRNVWVAESPDWKGRRLTSYTADDGQEIGELSFTPDGKAIVFTRGGDLETRRDIPNPTSSPQPVEQAIFVVQLAGGAPRKLSDGSSPVLSPKGDRLVFSKSGALWSMMLDGSDKPAQLIHAKGRVGGARFSPDGTMLAIVNGRGTHGYVGVYRFADKSLRYLDASVDTDREPAWSPDGRQIAFLRVAASSRAFSFGPVRDAEPWSIRVADVATGAGRQVWKADKGAGSAFSPIVGESQVMWAEGGNLVFPWEKTGWKHLYKVSIKGDRAVELTSGPCEVEHASLGADGSRVLWSSNCGDIDRRHISATKIADQSREEVTKGSGLEWSPVDAGGGVIAMLRSDWKLPARPAVSINGAVKDLAPDAIPADFPAAEMVEPRQVIFPSADGTPIHAQLFLPRNATGKRPAIVFYHGGSRRQMLLGWHYMYYYSNTYAMNQYWAGKGYVVLSVNYRSGTGYGMEFREALDYGATGASEVQDVIGAALYLRTRNDVDGSRVASWGGSYGGYLTAMALARASHLYAAGVDIHGVHDWNVVIRNFVPAYDPEKQREVSRVAFASSPMASVSTWKSPVLLIHGDDDRNVPFSESVRLAESLRKQGVEFEQLVFPDEVHDFLTHAHWLQAMRAADDFLGRKLKNP